jgi:hypothetical protein
LPNGGPPPGNVSVLTSKNDNARSGLNPNETLLNPTTVASAQFHKLGSWTLDGFMQAQPLYVPGGSPAHRFERFHARVGRNRTSSGQRSSLQAINGAEI